MGRGLGVGEEVAVEAFTILSSTLAAVLIYLVARGPFGTRVALLAAMLWVTYPYILAHCPALLSKPSSSSFS